MPSKIYAPNEPERYPIVYADPSVKYNDRGGPQRGKSAADCYPTLSPFHNVVEIDKHAAASCVLFCWKTLPTMHAFWPLLDAAGFRRRTTAFVWVKRTKHGKLCCGGGSWTNTNAELVDVYTRGKDWPRPKNRLKVHQIVEAQRGEHSAKPAEVRDRIDRLMGDDTIPRIEMFARERVDGWDAHGLEVDQRLDRKRGSVR